MSSVVKGVGKVFKKVVKVAAKAAPYIVAAAAIIYTAGAAAGVAGMAGGWGGAAASVASSLGMGETATAVLTGAVYQAGIGAVTGAGISAITGQKISKGLKMGAAIGAATGAVTGLVAPGLVPKTPVPGGGAPGAVTVTDLPAATQAADAGNGLLSTPMVGDAGIATPVGAAPVSAAPATASMTASTTAQQVGKVGTSWLEAHPTAAGMIASGAGNGLLALSQAGDAKDAAQASIEADRQKRADIAKNYATTSNNGLLPDQPTGAVVSRPDPATRFSSGYGFEYVWDPNQKRIVKVQTGGGASTALA